MHILKRKYHLENLRFFKLLEISYRVVIYLEGFWFSFRGFFWRLYFFMVKYLSPICLGYCIQCIFFCLGILHFSAMKYRQCTMSNKQSNLIKPSLCLSHPLLLDWEKWPLVMFLEILWEVVDQLWWGICVSAFCVNVVTICLYKHQIDVQPI